MGTGGAGNGSVELLLGFSNVYISALILKHVFLVGCWMGVIGTFTVGGKGGWLGRRTFTNFKSIEMLSFLQCIWDAVQKRPKGADLRQLS